MKINSLKDYEENHKMFEEVSDSALYDYFLIVQDLYERVSAEAVFRLTKEWKINGEKKD